MRFRNAEEKKAMEALVSQIMVENDGHVTPTEVVNRSKPETSPTHVCFEWDDERAGHEYRLIQARHYLRVVVVKDVFEEKEVEVKLAHVPPAENKGEGSYRPITRIVQSPSDFERALSSALADLESARRRVNELKDQADKMGDNDKVAVLASIAMTLSTAGELLRKIQ